MEVEAMPLETRSEIEEEQFAAESRDLVWRDASDSFSNSSHAPFTAASHRSDMDWTGGARHRFAAKGKNNDVLQKQKAHFAKGLQKPQPFEAPDFLRYAIASRSHQPPMSFSHHDQTRPSMDHGSEASTSRRKRPHSGGETSSNKRHRMSNALSKAPPEPRSCGRYGSDGTGNKHGKAMPAVLPRPTNIDDEDRLLLANRERLLARNDWLGLSAARPLRMKFPAASDKENVGKRHRIHKSRDQKAKPARQRSHTPLFRQELRPRVGTLSNPEPDVDMHIKIGTDAFATQTQTSRRSQTTANTSMRPPSTEFGPISEESMLLGVDGDGFELKTDGAAPLQNMREPDVRLQTDFTGPSYDFAAPTVSMAPSFQLSQDSEPVSTLIYREREQSRATQLYNRQHIAAYVHHDSYHDDAYEGHADDFEGDESHTFDTSPAEGTVEHIDSEYDDDETFRTLMEADATLSGKSSMAAMASSSRGASTKPVPLENLQPQSAMKMVRYPDPYCYGEDHDGLAMRSDSLLAEPARTTKSEQYEPTELDTLVTFGSPSTSLRQLYQTMSRPTEVAQLPPEAPTQDEDDDEALWRSIVLKSQGSDSATSNLADTVQKTWLRKPDDLIEPAAYSSYSKASTESLQSDKATFGGSVLAGFQGSDRDSRQDLVLDSPHLRYLALKSGCRRLST
ncbi:hypothetical protein DOTSEDRAFT_77364 [Dothistroma septosporum NZE10]|uniref:Uncharacterized protein n=1 Tax=Dothistroma septosporum (strain NZE10 / CBS 128990) TaxID=675120 RepID=N1Q5A9_DOTSN|nr:hypothetical protein DOTSEDRAFT_77364 [Dothistroma septosporum NZE10]